MTSTTELFPVVYLLSAYIRSLLKFKAHNLLSFLRTMRFSALLPLLSAITTVLAQRANIGAPAAMSQIAAGTSFTAMIEVPVRS